MTKRLKPKQKIIPIVTIAFQDHSYDHKGIAIPRRFVAVGMLLLETPEGYVLGHWVDSEEPLSREDIDQVTTYIAKVKGLAIETIGHWVVS